MNKKNKKNGLVSVIIPIYNAEKVINRCVSSLLNQTYKNIEIILVNDGSIDNSKKICDELAKSDKRIRVFHKKNSGSGDTRNFGLKNSKGDYILFLDSDDFIELDTIQKMSEYINDYDVVCVGFDRVDEVTKKIYSKEMINMPFEELAITDGNIMETSFLSPACWGKLFKKELLKGVEFSSNTVEDILFYTELIPKIKKMKFIKEILWHYMVTSNSLVTTFKEKTADEFEQDLLLLKNKYNNNLYSKEKQNFLTLQVIIHDCISLPSRLYKNNDININKRIKHIKKYMNVNFPDWKHLKIKIKGRFAKKMAIYIIIFMYRINIFKLFLISYNFMIDKLKIDIKW